MAQDTATVSWGDGVNFHIRVYSSNGVEITERCWDPSNDKWYTGLFKDPGQNVSATCWKVGFQVHIRVYASNAGVTTEWCWDGDVWHKGAYTS